MSLFGRKRQPEPVAPPAPSPLTQPNAAPSTNTTAPSTAATDWSDINSVRAEWPQSALNAQGDLHKWHEGIALYDNDDYASMMRCATLLSPSLAHSLYDEGVLRGDDLPNTVFKVLYACLEAPPDGRTFADSAKRSARLVLTLIRENGWQPKSMGGDSDFFDKLLIDKGNYLLLGSALGPADRPWEGDLKAFFAAPPTRLTPEFPDQAGDSDAINRLYSTLQQSKAGDPASQHHMSGMGLWANGNEEAALAELNEAAKLGSVTAMKDAGDLVGEMGRADESRFWFESAANAGNSAAMWNMAVLAFDANELDTAATWYQRSAEAGEADGFAALTQLASDRGDEANERRWSRLGAEAGQTFCMARHGLWLLTDSDADVPTLRRARDFLEAASARGNQEAMSLAVSVNHQLGDLARGKLYVDMVLATGNADEIDRLRRHDLL